MESNLIKLFQQIAMYQENKGQMDQFQNPNQYLMQQQNGGYIQSAESIMNSVYNTGSLNTKYQQPASMQQQPQPMSNLAGTNTGLNFRYKTQLCRHFQSTGYCHQGLNCQFAHGSHQLRKTTDPLPNNIPDKPVIASSYRTVPCRFYQQGYCKNQTNCTFAHEQINQPMQFSGQMPMYNYMQPDQNENMQYMQMMAGGASGGAATTNMQQMQQQQDYYQAMQNMNQAQQPQQHQQSKAQEQNFQMSDQQKNNTGILDILYLNDPNVQQQIKSIKQSIDQNDDRAAQEKILSLYQGGKIVDIDLYHQYKKIKLQQG